MYAVCLKNLATQKSKVSTFQKKALKKQRKSTVLKSEITVKSYREVPKPSLFLTANLILSPPLKQFSSGKILKNALPKFGGF